MFAKKIIYKGKTINVNIDIYTNYCKKVREVNNKTMDYLFLAFDIDINSDKLNEDIEKAMSEELEVANNIPSAIHKAEKGGIFG